MKRSLPPIPKVLLENGKRPCRGCGSPVPPGRQTWCGNECRERHYMALSSHARRKLRERDKGVCALCGADSEKVERILWLLRRKGTPEARHASSLIARAWGGRWSDYGWNRHAAWEADHKTPLVEGGTHELDNYRTLCRPCHKSETAALARRRSRRSQQTAMALAPEARPAGDDARASELRHAMKRPR